jgi:hypothetical protein
MLAATSFTGRWMPCHTRFFFFRLASAPAVALLAFSFCWFSSRWAGDGFDGDNIMGMIWYWGCVCVCVEVSKGVVPSAQACMYFFSLG